MRITKFLQSSALFSLYVAHEEIIRHFQAKLAEEDVHFIQALIITGLFFEAEDKSVRPSVLAEHLQTSRSNISHAIRDLEKKGFIARSTSPHDARAYEISLTKTGRKRAPRLVKIFDSTQNKIEALGGERVASQLQSFVELYRRLMV